MGQLCVPDLSNPLKTDDGTEGVRHKHQRGYYEIVRSLPSGIHIGTSGWSYPEDWLGVFYTSRTSLLNQYLRYFHTAEINSTFYSLPKSSFIRHLAQIPGREVFFTAKLPRAVTHDARLDLSGEGGQVLQEFFELMRPLADSLACLLIQLPPWDRSQMADRELFLSSLDESYRYAIEFRHSSWLTSGVERLLEHYDIAYVVVDEPLLPPVLKVTTDFAYIRWHGHGKRPWYDYRYSVEELRAWVPRVHSLEEQAGAVLGYFNNHFEGNSALNALQMLELLDLANPHQSDKLRRMLKRLAAVQSELDDFC